MAIGSTSTISNATAAVDTITATGAGALNLGATTSWTGAAKLASITATGAGAVTATIDGTVTAFTGGSGDDVLTVSTGISKTLDGGTGSNTLILNAAASSYNGVLNPNGAIHSLATNFQTLDLASGATGNYNASGFTALKVDALGAAAAFTNVAAGTGLTVTAAPGYGIGYVYATGTSTTNTFDLTLGTAATAASVDFGTITDSIGTAGTSGVKTISVHSLGTGVAGKVNTVALADNTTGIVTTLNVDGTEAADVNYAPATSSAITAINVTNTAAVDVVGVYVAAAGATYTGGAGRLTVSSATTGNVTTSVDSIVSGAGGVTATIGIGGAGGAAGSESVNLAASTAVQDSLTVANASSLAGRRVGVTGYQVTSSATTSDLLVEGTTKTAVSNAAAGTLSPTQAAGTYTASNGIITFGATESSSVNIQLLDAQAIVNASGDNKIAAFVNGGHTYVVTSDNSVTDKGSFTNTGSAVQVAADYTTLGYSAGDGVTIILNGVVTGGALKARDIDTTAHLVSRFNAISGGTYFSTTGSNQLQFDSQVTNSGSSLSSRHIESDGLVQLSGITGVQGFGGTAASNTILTTGVTNVGATSITAANTNVTTDDTGFSLQAITGGTATAVQTINNLAASAIITDAVTVSIGGVVTTQVGAAGTNSLTYSSSAAHTVTSLNVTGDNALTLTSGADTVFTSIVDGATTDTLAKISITGAGATTVSGITDTALTSIDASAATGAIVLGGSSALLSQTGLTVAGGTVANSIYVSGANDVITVAHAGAAGHLQTVTASGAGTSITLSHNATTLTSGDQYYVITANGIGDTINTSSVTNYGSGISASTISATGANDTLTLGAGLTGAHVVATLGQNATVTLGALGAGAGYVDLAVTAATANADSAGTFLYTTIKGAVAATNTLRLPTLTEVVVSTSAIDVAKATSLGNALDLVATGSGLTAGQGYLSWFQYGGNTYFLENIAEATATTGIDANDIIVKLTGLVDIGTLSVNSHVVAL